MQNVNQFYYYVNMLFYLVKFIKKMNLLSFYH